MIVIIFPWFFLPSFSVSLHTHKAPTGNSQCWKCLWFCLFPITILDQQCRTLTHIYTHTRIKIKIRSCSWCSQLWVKLMLSLVDIWTLLQPQWVWNPYNICYVFLNNDFEIFSFIGPCLFLFVSRVSGLFPE